MDDALELKPGDTNLHVVSFYRPKLEHIHYIVINRRRNRLAVSRKNGVIDIWNVHERPILETTLPENPSRSVEGIVWSGKRLFCVSVDGIVYEWNVETASIVNIAQGVGKTFWCIDNHPDDSDLAVGTDEGYINIYDITDKGLTYTRVFHKEKNRIMTCRFSFDGKYLITGCLDYIGVWFVQKGICVNRIPIPTTNAREENSIIWSLQSFKPLTIVAGDSNGYLTIVDGKSGAYIERIHAMKADILSIAVSDDENFIVCAGIDPTIRIYMRVKTRTRDNPSEAHWVSFLKRSIHDHDVKAVSLSGHRLFSGGVDGYLTECSILKTNVNHAQYGSFDNEACDISRQGRMLLLRYSTYLELWTLGSVVALPQDQRNLLLKGDKRPARLVGNLNKPVKLLKINSSGSSYITSATISYDGQWLAFSKYKVSHLYYIQRCLESGNCQVARVNDVPLFYNNTTNLKFLNKSNHLLAVCKNTQKILLFIVFWRDIDNEHKEFNIDLVDVINTKNYLSSGVKFLTLSADDQLLAVTGMNSQIHIWCMKKKSNISYLCHLPKYKAPVSALDISCGPPSKVVIAYSDCKIAEFYLRNRYYSLSREDDYTHFEDTPSHPITSLRICKTHRDVFVAHNDSYLLSLKKTNKHKESQNFNHPIINVNYFKHLQHVLYSNWISDNELLVASASPEDIANEDVCALLKPQFGTE